MLAKCLAHRAGQKMFALLAVMQVALATMVAAIMVMMVTMCAATQNPGPGVNGQHILLSLRDF